MRRSGIGIYYFSKKEIYRRAQSLSKQFSVNSTALFIEENQNKLIFNNYDYNNFFLSGGKILCNNYDIHISELNINNSKITMYTMAGIYSYNLIDIIFSLNKFSQRGEFGWIIPIETKFGISEGTINFTCSIYLK